MSSQSTLVSESTLLAEDGQAVARVLLVITIAESEMFNENRIDRRQFAERLTAISAAAVIAAPSTTSIGEDKPAAEPPDNKPNEAPANKFPGKIPEPLPEVLLLKYLTIRYPSDQFDESALKGIYGDLRADAARGRILSEFPLKNSDEPSFVFRAYRAAP